MDRQLQKKLNNFQGKLFLSVHVVALFCVHRHLDFNLFEAQCDAQHSLLALQQHPSCVR